MKTDNTQPAVRTTADVLIPFHSLESAMCDTLQMADLACDVVSDAVADRRLHNDITGKEDLVYLTEHHADRMIFVTMQVSVMMRALYDAYYAAYNAQPGEVVA